MQSTGVRPVVVPAITPCAPTATRPRATIATNRFLRIGASSRRGVGPRLGRPRVRDDFGKGEAPVGPGALRGLGRALELAMSSLRISSIARITRCERSGSGSMSSSPSTVGTICHDTPNRSSSQPHSPCVPPSDRDSHRPSTSSWVSQFTTNEIAGVNAELGAAVQRDELLPLEQEVDRHHGARGPRTGLAVPRDAEDLGLAPVARQGAAGGERRDVEVRGILGLVVEPQARSDLRCVLDPHGPPPSPGPSAGGRP